MEVMRALLLLFCTLSLGTTEAGKCPFGWTPFGEKCYKFFSSQVDWITAEKNCQRLNSNLASVRSQVENELLLSLVPVSARCWVGGHDWVEDGQWLWSDGTTFDYTNWCAAEPSGNTENCLEINWTSKRCWNDENFSTSMGYICAKGM
ncbi:ladderlectin-like [Myxocyprinus asiaticus]|uniref:ladderlectin-like n=1 Tax=Myxocyprinus asiaticus TaxID=70543 RepID=UPI002222DDF4|nr:ladderlectin-like [Myxocyprinus asiaticus]XP_051565363.1 ladderlectin-like [Myxocyprinus asiaticus]